jgi:hypothetical protein
MKKDNGLWTCEIVLPKGEVIYKFLVNDQYLADGKTLCTPEQARKFIQNFMFGEERMTNR